MSEKNVETLKERIQESIDLYDHFEPKSLTDTLSKSQAVFSVLEKKDIRRQARNLANRTQVEKLRTKAEMKKLQMEKELLLVEGYPISGLAKMMTTLGITLTSGSMSALTYLFISSQELDSLNLAIGSLLGVMLIGAIVFSVGYRSWRKDENEQKKLFQNIIQRLDEERRKEEERKKKKNTAETDIDSDQ